MSKNHVFSAQSSINSGLNVIFDPSSFSQNILGNFGADTIQTISAGTVTFNGTVESVLSVELQAGTTIFNTPTSFTLLSLEGSSNGNFNEFSRIDSLVLQDS